MKLYELNAGESGIILNIKNVPIRLIELGLLKGEQIKVLLKGAKGGPVLIKTCEKNIAISKNIAEKIKVVPLK